MRYESYKPESLDKEIWKTLIEAWENGLSDREACFRVLKECGVDINTAQLRRMYADNPKMHDLRDMLRDEIVTASRLVVKESVVEQRNEKTARWVLEHLKPDEFSTKAAIAFERAAIEVSVSDKEESMKKFMEQFDEK